MSHQISSKPCSARGCKASFKLHYWGSVKAHADGWMVQQNGDAWCPDHLPAWVGPWRERKARERRARQQPPPADPTPSLDEEHWLDGA